MPPVAMAGPDDASDTPEAKTISRTKNATRRVERAVMRSSLLLAIERGHHGQSAGYTENEGIIDDKQSERR
jgi:hypothetical protein